MKQTVIATFEQAAQAARRRVFTGGMAAGALMIGIGAVALLANTVAFFTVLQGIAQIILYAEMKDLEVPGYGWVLAGGLLNVVVGNLIVIRPITGWMAVSTVWGIYLIVSGVAVLVETLADQRGRRVGA